ncbi:MAG: hypothetical protein NTW48_09120, partial [Chloroflexi bacterium]|nr:hypothetical protein [Chloroflexota bacterium]
MKLLKTIKRMLKDESGQALAMALIMLMLGGLLVVPTLSFMTTNLNANRQIDRKNLELYAADAGVEHALWRIQYETGFELPPEGGGDEEWQLDTPINDRTVNVSIRNEGGENYKITSIASDGVHSTTVKCYINTEADLSWFFDSAITAAQDVIIKPGTEVTGNVTYGGTITYKNRDQIDGELIPNPDLAASWPTAEYLSSYYYAQVADLNVEGSRYPSSQITISGGRTNPTTIPRLYRNGNLELKGDGWARLGVDTKAGTADATEANFLRDA